jgi:CRP-like cAMP-binding protein
VVTNHAISEHQGCIQGDPGDLFYIIKEGEAVVYQDTPRGVRLVNRLFKSDFFGEQALMRREPRMASVEAVSQRLVCLALRRDVFVNLLGDLHEIMNREKSPQVCFFLSSAQCACAHGQRESCPPYPSPASLQLL